jgi:membrane fusion protein (multidrug efflux system)
MSRLRRIIVRLALLVGIPAIAAVAGAAIWLHGGRYIGTENAYVKADIVQVAPEIAGRVIEVVAHDHTPVKAGQVLVKLDPEPFRLALDKADAELDAARAQVETLRASWRETKNELAEVENRAAFLARQSARQQELASRGVASPMKRDEVENEAHAARDRVAVVRQRLTRVLTALNGDPNLATEQHPLVREKRAQRERVAYDLGRTAILAPVGGIAVNVKLQPGEQVKAATPLFVIVAETRPWIEANFKETELTHVRPGQRASVVLDIYPDVTWEATVDTISPATGAEFAILPPQNASGNWVKVVQRLPVRLRLEPHQGEPPLRAGMTATVSIDTGRVRKVENITAFFGKLTHGSAVAANRP